MLREHGDARLGMLGQPPEAARGGPAIRGEDLAARVGDQPAVVPRDDRGENRHGDRLRPDRAHLPLLGVAERRDARAQLREHSRVGEVGGRSGASADDAGRDADGGEGRGGRGERLRFVARGGGARLERVAVAREGEDADHVESGGDGGGAHDGILLLACQDREHGLRT
ncbi:hypothetical protein NB037_19125, partial [Rathayibacter sp. ZW T2_19]|nr:hypothetical protein [Rathayibacter rubneri]